MDRVKTSTTDKYADGSKQIYSGTITHDLYVPQVRAPSRLNISPIVKIGELEFANEWVKIPYTILRSENALYLEKFGILLPNHIDADLMENYGLPFEAAESMRWAFLAMAQRLHKNVQTRIIENRVKKTVTVNQFETPNVYDCGKWRGVYEDIGGNSVADQLHKIYDKGE